MKIAFSGASLIRFRITYTNWPTVRSYIGTIQVQHARHNHVYSGVRTDGTRYFFLSIVGISVLSAFSQMTYREYHAQHAADKWAASGGLGEQRTGILSGYFCLMRSASALRLSVVQTAG